MSIEKTISANVNLEQDEPNGVIRIFFEIPEVVGFHIEVKPDALEFNDMNKFMHGYYICHSCTDLNNDGIFHSKNEFGDCKKCEHDMENDHEQQEEG